MEPPPDWGGTGSSISEWRWHSPVSIWELCQHPRVGCQCATGCPMRAPSCPVSVSPARNINQASPCPETWGHICPQVSVCTALPCLVPPPQNPGNPSHACRGGDAALSPSRRSPAARAAARLPGRADAAPPRRVAASTLTCVGFLCPSRCGSGSTPSLPPLRRPHPPAQPPPGPATHTSELFCVFQQLKRIKQQLSPGRAWILVTLIFCVAGQGEWGY